MKRGNIFLVSLLMLVGVIILQLLVGKLGINGYASYDGNVNNLAVRKNVGAEENLGSGENEQAMFSPPACFSKTYGGANLDEAGAIERTSDGGYIIGATTKSYGDVFLKPWLIKTQVDGSVCDYSFSGMCQDNDSFVKLFNVSQLGHGYGRSIKQIGDGGYVLLADMYGYGSGYYNFWLIKTNASGNTCDYVSGSGLCTGSGVFSRTFGVAGNSSHPKDIQKTSDGGYVMVGSIIGGLDDGNPSYTNDIWLIKTDAQGNTCDYSTTLECIGLNTFVKRFGSSGEEFAYSVQQTIDGGFLIGGESSLYGNHGPFGSNVWIIKTDASGDTCNYKSTNGNCQGAGTFSKIYSRGAASGGGIKAKQALNGGYVFVTSSMFATPTGYKSRMWIVKTDSLGNTCNYLVGNPNGTCSDVGTFSRTFGNGDDIDYGVDIEETSQEEYVLASNIQDGFVGLLKGARIVKINQSGDSCNYSSTGECYNAGLFAKFIQNVTLKDIALTNDNGYVLVGEIRNETDGTTDIEVMKIVSTGECFNPVIYHPADMNRNFTIEPIEALNYTAYFKKQLPWPTQPNPISSSYWLVSRALFKKSPNYHPNSTVVCGDPDSNPGRCWIPGLYIAECGNGVLDSGEQCDNGRQCTDGTSCTSDPLICEQIGDWSCTRREGDGCGRTCLREECGNGYIDEAIGETCDDGNLISGDGCSQGCYPDNFIQLTFNKTYGSNSVFGPGRYEKAKSAIQLGAGGNVFVGETTSWNTPGCIWLVKTSPLGSVCDYSSDGTCSNSYSFVKKFCSGSLGNGKVVRTSWDEGYLIAGETLKSDGKKDILLIKTDIYGNELWNKTFGWVGSDEDAVDIVPIGNIGAENGYLILGRTTNELFTSQPPTSWLIRINLNGDTCNYINGDCDGLNEFVRIIGNKMTLMSQVIYQSDGFVLVGNTNSIGSVGMGGWLLKLDMQGNSCDYYSNANCSGQNQFSRFYKFAGAFNSVSKSFGGTGADGYVMGGTYYFIGDYQFFIVKTNLSGDTCNFETLGNCNDPDGKFARRMGSVSTADEIRKIVFSHFAQGYAFIGESQNLTTGKKTQFFAQTDSTGYVSCPFLINGPECDYHDGTFVRIFGGQGEDQLNDLFENTPENNYLLAGWTNSSNIEGKTQAWLVKTDTAGRIR